MKINVLLFTYNHVDFIENALEGIRIQQVNFPFEVFISDDGSTDGTRERIERFLSVNKDFPARLFYPEKNTGILASAKRMLSAVNAPYFALLDGDDYWTDPLKLQKQVDFLDKHPTVNGSIHDARFLHENGADDILFKGNKSYHERYQYPTVIFPNDLVKRLIFPTSAMVVRSQFIPNIPWGNFKDGYSITWKLTCYAIAESTFMFLKEEMSVYRNHLKGLSKGFKYQFHESHVRFLQALLKDPLYELYHLEIRQSIVFEIRQILENCKLSVNQKRKWYFAQLMVSLREQVSFYKRLFK